MPTDGKCDKCGKLYESLSLKAHAARICGRCWILSDRNPRPGLHPKVSAPLRSIS